MDKNKNCTVCRIKFDIDNYLKDRPVSKVVIIRIREKTTITLHTINKVESVDNKNNRTLIR